MKTLKNKVQSIFTLMFLTLMFSAGALADTPEAPENLKVIPDNWDQNGYVYLVADHEGDNDEYTYKVYRAEGRTDELSAFSALSEDEYEVYQTDTLKHTNVIARAYHGYGNTYSYYMTATKEGVESSNSNIVKLKLYNSNVNIHFVNSPEMTEAKIGEEWTYDADAVTTFEDGVIVYSIEKGPAGAEINSATGEVSWTPEDNGFYHFTLKAEVEGEPDLNDYRVFGVIVVKCENLATIKGTIVDEENGQAVKMSMVSLYGKTSDGTPVILENQRVNNGEYSFSVDEGSYTIHVDGFTNNNNRIFVNEWYENAENIEEATWIEVTCGSETTADFELESETYVNKHIEIVSTPNATAKINEQYSYQVEVETEGGDFDVNYILQHGPEGASLDAETGLLTWTPSEHGTYKFIIKAQIANDHKLDVQHFAVRVNHCEELSRLSGRVTDDENELVTQGQVYLFSAMNDTLNGKSYFDFYYSAEIKHGEYLIEDIDAGEYYLYFQAYSDENSKRLKEEFYENASDISDATIITIDCNQKLEIDAQLEKMPNWDTYVKITSEAPQSTKINQPFTYDVEAETNHESDDIKFELMHAPEDATIDAETGLISWTPTENGRYQFVVSASLSGFKEFSDYQDFAIVVSECDVLGSISGTVTDENGNQILHGMAMLFGESVEDNAHNSTVIAVELTNSGYKFEGIDKGTYYLVIQAYTEDSRHGYYIEWYDGKYDYLDADPIEIDCGDDVTIDFELEKIPEPNYYHVSGNVSDQNTGEGLSWVNVLFIGTEIKSGMQQGFHTMTDEHGNYSLELPDNFVYTAKAAASHYFKGNDSLTLGMYWPEYYEETGDPNEATELTLTADLEDIDFTLEAIADYSNSMSGKLKGESGDVIDKAMIVAFLINPFDDEYNNFMYFGRTSELDNEGNFTIENLIPGEYVLLAYPMNRKYVPGYYKENELAVRSWEDATRVEIGEEGDHGTYLITLEEHSKINGRGRVKGVCARDGKKGMIKQDGLQSEEALVGAMVYTTDENGNVVNTVKTDDAGEFVVEGLAKGTYWLNADKVGFYNNSTKVVIEDEDIDVNTSLTLDSKVTSVDDQFGDTQSGTVFPNPASSSVTLNFTSEQSGVAEVKLVDLRGNSVLTLDINTVLGENQVNINLDGVSSGTYFININDSNGIANIIPVVINK